MILVVGGLASGKRTFARGLGVPEAECAFDVHERVREGEDAAALADELAAKAVVTCAEVGNGIVPLDAGERAWREQTGRLASQLAERADAVVRMVCGVPVVLRGEVDYLNGCQSAPAEGGSPPAALGPGPAEGCSPTAARQMFLKIENVMPAQAANPPQQGRAPEQAPSIELVLVRHGMTPGNEEKRYVGVVDQPLSEKGRAQARAAGADESVRRVYVSRLRRTHETAAIMFPNAEQIVVDGIEEMDFGVFAGRSPDEMADDAAYRAWVESGCVDACPGGESQAAFTDRVCAALETLLREAHARGEQRVIVVGHGGTMMAFLSRYGNDPSKQYWDWLVGNCESYHLIIE